MLGGMICWAALFTLFYAGASLVCTPPLSTAAMSGFRIAATAIAIVSLMVLAAGIVMLLRRQAIVGSHSSSLQTFMINGTALLAIGGLIAIVWLAMPLLIFSDCRG